MEDLSDVRDSIDRLRVRVMPRIRRFLPTETSPRWLQGLGTIVCNDMGALALLGQARIGFQAGNNIRYLSKFDPSVLYLCGLVSRVRGTGRRIALGLPPGARHLPLLLAVTSVLACTLDKGYQNGEASYADGVLIISPDLDIRSWYCDLMIGDVQLDKVHRGSRMLPDGNRVFLRGYKDPSESQSQGVCFFLPQLELPKKVDFQPVTVIDDLRHARWVRRASKQATWIAETFPHAGSLGLYTTGDTETRDALLSAGFVDFPLDHTAIQSCLQYAPGTLPNYNDCEIADLYLYPGPSYLNRSHKIITIKGSDIIEQHFQAIRRLIDTQGCLESPGLNRAKWLLAALSQLPVPLVWYEEAARALGRSTIRRLINRLDVRNHADIVDPSILQTLRVQFEQLYMVLEQDNPRAAALRELLERECSGRGDAEVLVLVRDHVFEQALFNWLTLEEFSKEQWLSCLDIRGCPKYQDIATQKYKVSVVCGALPRRYRWIVSGALGARTLFLTYPHEVEAIRGQLLNVYGNIALTSRSQKRDAFIGNLAQLVNDRLGGPEASLPELVLDCPAVLQPISSGEDNKKKMVAVSLQDLADAFKERLRVQTEENKREQTTVGTWEDDVGDEALEEAPNIIYSLHHNDDIPCLKLKVLSKMQGTCYLWVDVNAMIETVRTRRPTEVVHLQPNEIEPGDVVLIVDERIRGDLFDKIVELTEQQPHLRYLAAYRRAWRDAILLLAAQFRHGYDIDYNQMLQALKNEGAPVQTELALKLWVNDQVIGPESLASIRAVGIVIGKNILVSQVKDFDRAFRHIRGIRTSLGRLLNAAIRRSFKGFNDPGDTGTYHLEERLLLPISELIETIDFAEVLVIDHNVVRVAPHFVGELFKAGED